jgi:hypothetical protein
MIIDVQLTNEKWIATAHAVREVRQGAYGTTRSLAPTIPAGSEA